MSFNVALGTSASALQDLYHLSSEQSGGHSPGAVASSLDDGPWCGTPVPGHPPIPHVDTPVLDAVTVNPQLLPPGGAVKGADVDDNYCGTLLPIPPIPPLPSGGVLGSSS